MRPGALMSSLVLALAQPSSPARVLEGPVQVLRIRLEVGATFPSAQGKRSYTDLVAVRFRTSHPAPLLPSAARGPALMLGRFPCRVVIAFLLKRGEGICLAPWPEGAKTALWLSAEGAAGKDEAQARKSERGEWLELSIPRAREPDLVLRDALEALRRLEEPGG
jgi:hypothetical protein